MPYPGAVCFLDGPFSPGNEDLLRSVETVTIRAATLVLATEAQLLMGFRSGSDMAIPAKGSQRPAAPLTRLKNIVMAGGAGDLPMALDSWIFQPRLSGRPQTQQDPGPNMVFL